MICSPIQSNCKNSNLQPLQNANSAKRRTGPSTFSPASRRKTSDPSYRTPCLPFSSRKSSFSWTKVKTLDLSTPSLQDRLSGLVLTAEVVNHLLVSRKNSQAASLAKLSAVIRCSAEVVAKSFPNAGTSLTTWADRLRARCLPQDPPGSSPARSQAGDHMSWGHPMPPLNLAL